MFLEGRFLFCCPRLINTIILITHDTSAPDCLCTIKLTQISLYTCFWSYWRSTFFVNGSKLPVHERFTQNKKFKNS